jgi:hypothetical protein
VWDCLAPASIGAIRENPWNVLTHKLPGYPMRLLLEVADFAATYCRNSEYMLTHAARAGCYVPDGWEPGRGYADAHEESEDCGFEADMKRDEIRWLYWKIYRETLGE